MHRHRFLPLVLALSLLFGNCLAAQEISRRPPHDGTFSFNQDHARATFSWLNVGNWQGYEDGVPGFELDIDTDERFYSACDSETTLPANYSDCTTAGISEEPGRISFGVGSFDASSILAGPIYEATWDLYGSSTIDLTDYSITWQEVYRSLDICPPFAEPWCWAGVEDTDGARDAGVIMEYILSKNSPEVRWWAWRDHSLPATSMSRLEPDGPYWSGVSGRHSGFLGQIPAGSNFDLHLLKWIDGQWVEVATSTSSNNANEEIEYAGQPGYYVWKVSSSSSSGRYQIGVAAPDSLPTPPLSVSLSTLPESGLAPLNGVDLTATLAESSPFTASYTFYCDRPDSGTNVTSGYTARFDGVLADFKTAADTCHYSTPGIYTAKVIVERGPSASEARRTITVSEGGAFIPTISTLTATSISQTRSILNLSAHPNGSPTTVWFRWGIDSDLGSPPTPKLSIGSGSTPVERSWTLTNLSCDTAYYFQAWAENSAGSAHGEKLSFRTDDCSGGGGGSADDLILNGDFSDDDDHWTASYDFHATDNFSNYHDGPGYAYLSESDGDPGNNLYGTLYQEVEIPSNATSATLTYWISISTSESSSASARDFLNATLQDGDGDHLAFLEILSNQDSSSGYFRRRFNLENFIGDTVQLHFLGTTNGSDPTVFRIDDVSLLVERPSGSRPSVTTLNEDQVDRDSARLRMTVNPNGLETDAWFEWDDDTNLSYETPQMDAGSGSSSITLNYTLSGLDCDTTYYFEAFAENSAGQDDGSQRSFTTEPCQSQVPSARSLLATSVTASSATLHGEINPNGLNTDLIFEWDDEPNIKLRRIFHDYADDLGWLPVSTDVNNLGCGQTYYFRIGAENSEGEVFGDTLTFATDSCPASTPQVETLPAYGVTSSYAVLNGEVTYYGLPTTMWYEWGTSTLDHQTNDFDLPTSSNNTRVQFELRDLRCETTYQYRIVAENEFGKAHGEILTFTTGDCPPGSYSIFDDSLESGDFSNWFSFAPSDGSGLAVESVAAAEGTYGLSLSTSACVGPDNVHLSDEVIDGTATYEACDEISATNVIIESGSDVSFLAGDSVVLGDGFSISSGARFRAGVGASDSSPRYLEDQSPSDEQLYWAEFVVDADELMIGPGASLDLLTGYNGDGQPLFRMGLFFDEEQGEVRSRFDLRSQNHTSWVARYGSALEGGFNRLLFLWRSAAPGDYARADVCRIRTSGTGCSFQYHSLVDRVESVRWGMPRKVGSVDGVIYLDDFSSGRNERSSTPP